MKRRARRYAVYRHANEPVHAAAGAPAQIPTGHISGGAAGGMRAAEITIPAIVKWPHTAAAPTWNTRHPTAVASHARDTIRMGERAEVVVKGTVLLHDHYDVLDLVKLAHVKPQSRRIHLGPAGGRGERRAHH
jgi:hypothetical protein